jgi:hypothetical protein
MSLKRHLISMLAESDLYVKTHFNGKGLECALALGITF